MVTFKKKENEHAERQEQERRARPSKKVGSHYGSYGLQKRRLVGKIKEISGI